MIKVKVADYMRYEDEGFDIVRPNGSGDYLFLYFPRPMDLYDGENHIITKKHACILLTPEREHSFCGHPVFANTYIHFETSKSRIDKFGNITNRIFYPVDFERINKIALDVKKELLTGMEFNKEMIHSMMCELLVLIKRSMSVNYNNDPLREQFEDIRRRLLSSFDKDIPVSDLMPEVCMSRAAFYERYKHYFNSSPKQDVLEMRMKKAALLLTDSRKTVSEVAVTVGFKNTEHFTRYYKQYFGCSPRR